MHGTGILLALPVNSSVTREEETSDMGGSNANKKGAAGGKNTNSTNKNTTTTNTNSANLNQINTKTPTNEQA